MENKTNPAAVERPTSAAGADSFPRGVGNYNMV